MTILIMSTNHRVTDEWRHFLHCGVRRSEAELELSGPRGRGREKDTSVREFDPEAIDLATFARVRHAHTRYYDLLAEGWIRDEARAEVRDDIDSVLGEWSRPQ